MIDLARHFVCSARFTSYTLLKKPVSLAQLLGCLGNYEITAQNESFDRLLRRATDPDPKRRYWSAEDMAEQLTGVLREVLSAGDGRPRRGDAWPWRSH